MNIRYSRDFKKAIKKLSPKIKQKFEERFRLFVQDPFSELLNNHALEGRFKGNRSINITGDYRAIYEENKEGVILFRDIGTHAQLYS